MADTALTRSITTSRQSVHRPRTPCFHRLGLSGWTVRISERGISVLDSTEPLPSTNRFSGRISGPLPDSLLADHVPERQRDDSDTSEFQVHSPLHPRSRSQSIQSHAVDYRVFWQKHSHQFSKNSTLSRQVPGFKSLTEYFHPYSVLHFSPVDEGDVPSTVLGSTQFQPFVHEVLEMVSRLPI